MNKFMNQLINDFIYDNISKYFVYWPQVILTRINHELLSD